MFNIGIDLGGTNIAAAIVDCKGKILVKKSIPTMRERNSNEIVNDMIALSLDIVEAQKLTLEDIHSIGIGSPGTINNDTGVIEYANNIKFKNVPIVKLFQEKIAKPVYIGNDANVAAYGEYESGAGEMYDDLVAITLGTGVGSGIVIAGKLIAGSFNGGAEIGHTVIVEGGIQCTCGRKGCWERYSSATALIKMAQEAARENKESLLNELVVGDLDKMNAKIPFNAAQAGDQVAARVIDEYVNYLAMGLANVVNIFQPEVIVLGGGVSAQKDNLIIPLKALMEDQVYGGKEAFKTEIKVAELGNDAGLIGAAMLCNLYDKQ